MWSVGQHVGFDYQILTVFEALSAEPGGETVDCSDRLLTLQLLRNLADDYFALGAFRWIVDTELRLFARSDAEVIDHVADLLDRGRLVLRRSWSLQGRSPALPVAQTARGPAAVERPTAWIKLQVLEDASGAPVSGVRLAIKRTDGMWTRETTGADGMIGIKGMVSGTCTAICDLTDAVLGDTLAVIPGSEVKQGPPILAGSDGPWRIARVEEHRVRTGETLEQLAARAGIGERERAYFNWGTRDPEQIKAHLCNDVGCTQLAADGNGFVFDDSDEPGVLYLPSVWEEPRLATETTHTVQVQRVAREEITGYVWVQLVSCFDHPLARIPCELRGGGRSWPAQSTSEQGELRWEDLPLDDYVLSLQLAGRSLELDVAWVREDFALHYERVTDADELLGGLEDPHGIQVRLLGLGHDPGAIDGVVGPKTRAAIEAFQEQQGLPRTGQAEAGVLQILADLFGG
jgi:hypothetical protein